RERDAAEGHGDVPALGDEADRRVVPQSRVALLGGGLGLLVALRLGLRLGLRLALALALLRRAAGRAVQVRVPAAALEDEVARADLTVRLELPALRALLDRRVGHALLKLPLVLACVAD